MTQLRDFASYRMDALSEQFGKLEATIDSGAAMIGFPKNLFNAYLSWRPSSIKGRTANGQLVPSEGFARVGIYTEDGTYHEMNGEVLDIQKILISVSAMVDSGHEVVFRASGSYVLLKSGQKLPLRRVNGVYTLSLYNAMRFHWQPSRV